MTPTDYEIARLISLALLLFALGCGPVYLAERRQNLERQQQQDTYQ